MDPLAVGSGKRVRIYLGEHDHAPGGKQPAWEAILQYLRREGAAGATRCRRIRSAR
jgi:PII-like signaling protein